MIKLIYKTSKGEIKMKLKILFLILTCALLVLCLAACGGEETCTVEFNTNGGGTTIVERPF